MKPVALLGLSFGTLLIPAALWQAKTGQAPLAPAAPSAQPAQAITRLPFTIDAPGRYVLAGSLRALARPPRGAEAGIVIRADHVELDLGGFVLMGDEGSTSAITIDLPERRDALFDVCVRNGTVTDWDGLGVDLSVVEGARVLDLHVSLCGTPKAPAAGLRVGAAAVVEGCTALANTGSGIVAGEGALVSRCLSDRNGLDGFALGGRSSARHCSATRNARDGMLLTGGGSQVTDCSAAGNGAEGIDAAGPAGVRDCGASGNGGSGLLVGRGSRVAACLATGNRHAGVAAVGGLCRIEDNHLVLNGSALEAEGSGHVIVRNTVSETDLAGGLLRASQPGGVFVPDPMSLSLSIAGVGSLRAQSKAGPEGAQLEEDGGQLAPWANIAVQ